MPSLREIRRKIKSVKSTQKITRAMKMVAAARLRRAQQQILNARPFANKMTELLRDLAGHAGLDEAAPSHPLLQGRSGNKSALVLVSADKGLCGAFNTNLIRKTLEFIRTNPDKEISLYLVGRKGRDFFRRMSVKVVQEYAGIFAKLTFAPAELIGKDIIAAFLSGQAHEVIFIYNEFKSAISQRLVVEKLLPIEPPQNSAERHADFIYEPAREKLLEALLPRYIKAEIYRILMESYAAELGARMNAMESATQNAGELMDALTLNMNRTRQAIITREIAELVGGAEALT